MFQGEIFAYPLYIARELTKHMQVKFLCHDTMCKFFPWIQRVAKQCSGDDGIQKVAQMKPFLSVMHGKAHDWACQVSFFH